MRGTRNGSTTHDKLTQAHSSDSLRDIPLRRTLGRAPARLEDWTIVDAAFGRPRGAKRRWVVLAVYQQTFAGTGQAGVRGALAILELVYQVSVPIEGRPACLFPWTNTLGGSTLSRAMTTSVCYVRMRCWAVLTSHRPSAALRDVRSGGISRYQA